MEIFDSYQNYGKNKLPLPEVFGTDKPECIYAKPFEDYDNNGNLVGYYWNYGQTVYLQFDLDGELAIENSSLVFTTAGSSPNSETTGYIGQKCYNVIDRKSWTCVAIVDGEFTWAEDEEFLLPEAGDKLVYIDINDYLKGMLAKITFYNFKFEKVYSVKSEASSHIRVTIDSETSKKFTKGIYYMTLRIIDEENNDTTYVPGLKGNYTQITVK